MFIEQEILHDVPFTLHNGEVIDSAVLSPHNSILNDNGEYQITVTFSSTMYVDELERMFRWNEHPHLEHENTWKVDNYTIRVTSLIKPRASFKLTEEYQRGVITDVRCRAEVVEGSEKAIERVNIIGLLEPLSAVHQSIDWDAMPKQQYDW